MDKVGAPYKTELHVLHTIATWAPNDSLESRITPSDFSFDDNVKLA